MDKSTTPSPAQNRQRLRLLLALFWPALFLFASVLLPATTWAYVLRGVLILGGGFAIGWYLSPQRRHAQADAEVTRQADDAAPADLEPRHSDETPSTEPRTS